MNEEIDLSNKLVSDSDAMNRVVKAQAELAKARAEVSALRKDRDDALDEYNALRAAKFPVKRDYTPKPKTKTETVRIIANDVHGSMMDRPAVEAFLADVRRIQPDEIVLNGDIVECGGFLAKHHAANYIAQTTYSYQDDIAHGNWFLDQLQDAAPNAQIHFIEGNHEDRVERWVIDETMSNSRDAEFLRQLNAPEFLLNLKERGIIYYRRSETHVPGLPPGWIKMGKIFFVHELSGSKNAASDSVSRTAGNVVFAHTHREDSATRVLPGVGLVKAWNPGCLCQRQPLWRHSDPTGWSHGYGYQVIAKSGEFLHINVPIWQGRSLLGNMLDGR